MGNRPTCPGPVHWWWEDTDGCTHVAEFDHDMECCYFDEDGYDYLTVVEFEDLAVFQRWVVRAVLPKKLQRCDLDGGDYIGENIGNMVDNDNGYYVRYKDVKEYDVKE